MDELNRYWTSINELSDIVDNLGNTEEDLYLAKEKFFARFREQLSPRHVVEIEYACIQQRKHQTNRHKMHH